MKHLYGHTLESLAARCEEDGDCLIWKAGKYSNGAPRIHVHGEHRTMSARKVWLELQGEEMGGRRRAYSTCGNPLCLAHAKPKTPKAIGKAADELTG